MVANVASLGFDIGDLVHLFGPVGNLMAPSLCRFDVLNLLQAAMLLMIWLMSSREFSIMA